jgi:hypothetical protein
VPHPTPITLVVCDRATVEGDGKVTLHGLFDVIWATGFPTRHGQIAVFSRVRFAAPGEARVVLEAPDGTPLAVATACRADRPGTAQAVSNLVDVELPSAGEYTVQLIVGDQTVASTAFEVGRRQ